MKKILYEIEDNFCAGILLCMTILTFINVIARYLFQASMPFVEELTCLGLVILSIVGAAVAAKRGAHLGLSVLTDLLPVRVQKYIAVTANVLGIILGGIILYFGYLMSLREYRLNLLTAGMQWPEWIFGMSVPFGGLFLIIRYALMTYEAIKELKIKEEA